MPAEATGRVVHIDQHLSNIAIDWQTTGFIADQLAPIVNVGKRSDTFPVWTRADIFRRDDTKRSDGDEAKVVSITVGSDQYRAENYALKFRTTVEDVANRDPAFVRLSEEGKTRYLMDKLMIDWESRVSSLMQNTANVGSSSNVASAWNDFTNSTPLEDFWTARDNMQDATGYLPTDVLFSVGAWRSFRQNDNVRNSARNPNVSAGDVLPNQSDIARLLEIERIHVGRAYINTAQEGIAESLAPIWPEHMWLYHRPAAPSLEIPSYMYSFRWAAAGLENMQARRLAFNDKRQTEEVQIGYYQDERVTAKELSFGVFNVNCSQ